MAIETNHKILLMDDSGKPVEYQKGDIINNLSKDEEERLVNIGAAERVRVVYSVDIIEDDRAKDETPNEETPKEETPAEDAPQNTEELGLPFNPEEYIEAAETQKVKGRK